MSRQPTAYHVAAAQSGIRKGLCLLLTVFCTLLLCQQYQHWNPPVEKLVHTQHTITLPRLSAVSAQADAQQGRVHAADVVDRIDQAPREPRWVF